jgi:geranylgeranyl pyrophosphate synthase
MWQGKQRQLLKEETSFVVSLLPDELHGFVREPLNISRRALACATEQETPWVLLPLIVCESISGSFEKALPLGASLQFFMAAGDVFDDIEDNDNPNSLNTTYGSAIATNIATTLLILAEKAITRLKDKDIEDKNIVRILDTVNSYYINACTGQHMDLSLNNDRSLSEDNYLKILSLKSASQIECACYTGALLATENNALPDIFKDFGYNLGMMAQITNDISGILTGKDILKRKITLPVIFAFSQSEGEIHTQLEDYYINKLDSTYSIEQFLQILSNTGSIHYTAIKLESFRLNASDALNRAEQDGINTERLREFLK